jgi:subtilisin
MRRMVSVLAGLALLGALAAVAPFAPAAASVEADPDVVPGSWIVQLRPDRDPRSDAPALANRYGGRVGHVYTNALGGFSFSGSEAAAAALARNPNVVRVEANRMVRALAPAAVPTGVQRIDATDGAGAASLATNGSGVSVAVLDTGIDPGHEAFGSRVVAGKACTGSSTADGNGHGTHVAGTIGGAGIGVAQGVRLVPVKVLDDAGSGSWASVICGIDYVTANAGTIKVANMSLGGSSTEDPSSCASSTLHQAICNSVGAGVTYVVAAGNDARNSSGFVPAKYPSVTTVSAYSDLDGVRDPATNECIGKGPWKDCDEQLAGFSNYGSVVDVTAPGVRIYSSVPGGYGSKSGTSMAAPHVAGVAALVIAAGKATGPAAVDAWLKSTGECPAGTWATGGACSGSWRNDPDGVAEPMVNAARAVSGASQQTVTHSLSVTVSGSGSVGSDPAGIDCGSACQATFAAGTSVVLTATAGSGSVFTGWSGACSGTTTCAVTMDGAKSVTATFAASASDPEPDPSGIVLAARGYKVKGFQHADLGWSGTTTNVDVYRDGALIAADRAGGAYTDDIGVKGSGSYAYQVCPTGVAPGAGCSNAVTVTF